MRQTPTGTSIKEESPLVKSPVPNRKSPFSKLMTGFEPLRLPDRIVIRDSDKIDEESSVYGVIKDHRVLSPPLFMKKYDDIRDYLEFELGLAPAQREVVMKLLRFWAYYGIVYPKEYQVTAEPGCSKPTFWRTIAELKELGLVHVINRYLCRPHAQISNLYRLDRLLLVLARYLAEKGQKFTEACLKPFLAMTGARFWSMMRAEPVRGP